MEYDELPVTMNPTTQLDQQRVVVKRWICTLDWLQLFVTTSCKNCPIVGRIGVHRCAQPTWAVILRLLRSKRVAQYHAADEQVAHIARVIVATGVQQVVQRAQFD